MLAKMEQVSLILLLVGGSVSAFAPLPNMPWTWRHREGLIYEVEANGVKGSIDVFPARSYSLLTVTDHEEMRRSWFHLASAVCSSLEIESSPNAEAVTFELATGRTPKGKDIEELETRYHALNGCVLWPACEQHMHSRCSAYGHISRVGVSSFLFLMIAVISASASAALVALSVSNFDMPEQRRLHSGRAAGVVAAVGASSCFIGAVSWISITGLVLDDLKGESLYPFPDRGCGPIVCYLSCLCLSIATYTLFEGQRQRVESITKLLVTPM